MDLRGDGGMIVAPPSIHASGASYAWVRGHRPRDLDPARLPRWLLRETSPHDRRMRHSRAHWRGLVAREIDEGARDDTVASLAGHLLWHGVDPDVVAELLLRWNRERCRPQLPDDQVARTVQSITRLHERGEDPKE